MPMASAPIGPTKPEAGVIATRPATAAGDNAQCAGFAVSHPLQRTSRSGGGGGGDLGDQHRHAGAPFGASALPALKPNQPTQSMPAPTSVSDRLCGVIGVLRKAAAFAHHQCGNQARDPGVDVNHGAAGEIQHAHAAKPAAAPHPVGDRRVDQRDPQTP